MRQHGDLTKPLPGEARKDRHARRLTTKAHETREMQAALKRDGKKCRVPRCEFAKLNLIIDPCHERHRGMGGNPNGNRTTRQTVIALCRRHHRLYDNGDIAIEPLTHKGFDGPCDFYMLNGPERTHYATERLVGISETRR